MTCTVSKTWKPSEVYKVRPRIHAATQVIAFRIPTEDDAWIDNERESIVSYRDGYSIPDEPRLIVQKRTPTEDWWE